MGTGLFSPHPSSLRLRLSYAVPPREGGGRASGACGVPAPALLRVDDCAFGQWDRRGGDVELEAGDGRHVDAVVVLALLGFADSGAAVLGEAYAIAVFVDAALAAAGVADV